MKQACDEKGHRKFIVCIEDAEFPWNKSTITVPELRQLGSLPADMPVIEVAPDNSETTLGEDEIVELKPGHRSGKKVCFKRG